MLKQISIIIILGVLVLACNDIKRPKKPDNLISKAQMSDLLYDLYVVSAAKGVNRKLLEEKNFNPETYILEKYNLDSTRFAENNNYYAFDPEEYKVIVDKTKERLEADKIIYDDLRQLETDSIKKRRDSITNRKDSINKVKKGIKDSSFKRKIIKKMLDTAVVNKN
ncbi:DUF4296 domain-containing protein [Winogradskyella undariae]|uniref:DUF4296 domain-containing protein n=1 Tax=Winogradskyella undariae TaxID=1285465 RepID=UPI0015C8C7F9|nr:DUF4296 domain-containing protein [Winogradskyella undariae]